MKNVSRREFLRDAALGAVGVAALGMMGVSAAAEAEAAPAEKKIPDVFTDGSYFTKVYSMHGAMNVMTVIKDAKIESVKVVNHKDSYIIGELAVSTIPGRIVEQQSLNVDVVAGATVTSRSILRAVREAIVEAGGDPEQFSTYTAPVLKDESVEKEADAIVVGAGPSGMIAAWQLAVAGKKVLVFEKMPFVGGCMPMTSNTWNACGTRLHKVYGEQNAPLKGGWWESIEAQQDQFRSQCDPESPRYNPDIPYHMVMSVNASKVTDLLLDINMPFCPINETYVPCVAPGTFSRGGRTFVDVLKHHMDLAGVEFVLEAPVTELITEGDAVVGVKAKGADGVSYTAKAKAVVLASGGFIMNRELMEEYNPDDLKYFLAGPAWATGDGMLMAKNVGAGWDCMDQGVTSHYTSGVSYAEISFIHYLASPGLVVNAKGARFVSESLEYKIALKSFKEQEGTDFYWIFDERGKQGLSPSGNSYRLDYTFLLETGDITAADSLEELEEKLGMTELVNSLNTVNDCVANGKEDPFGNAKIKHMLTDGKMYALKVIPSPYIAQGGVKIDPETHVQREDGSIIAGLYACGDVTGSIECRDGAMYRVGLAQAVGYGLAACETVLKEI